MPKETRGRRRPRYSPLAGTVAIVKSNRMQGITYARPRRSLIMPPETKMFDTSFNQSVALAADWTGTEVPCTNFIQSDGTTVGAYTASALIPSAVGAGYGEIQGNKYFMKHIRVRGDVTPQATTDSADAPVMATCRVLLVHDTQPNGAQAQGEEVLTDMGSALQCNYAFLAMGAGAGGRFRILKDKVLRLQPSVAVTDGTNTNSSTRSGAPFSFSYRPKKPIQVILKANSATPTVASLSNNNIFLLAHSSSGANAISGCARCYYQD